MSRKNGQATVAIIGAFVVICILSYYSWNLSSESRTLKRLVVTTYSKLKDMTTHKNLMEKKNTLLSNRMVEMEERMTTEKQNAEAEQKQRSKCSSDLESLTSTYNVAENKAKKCEDASLQREKMLLGLLKDVNLENIGPADDKDIFIAKIKHLKDLLKSTGSDYQKLQDKYSELEKDKISLAEDFAKSRKDLQKCQNSHSTSSAKDQSENVDKDEKKDEGKKKNKSLKSEQEEKMEKKEAEDQSPDKKHKKSHASQSGSRSKLKMFHKQGKTQTKKHVKVELSDSKLNNSTSRKITEVKPASTKPKVETTPLPTPTVRTKSDFQEGDTFFSKVVEIPGKGEAENPKTSSPMLKNNKEDTERDTMEFDKKAFHDGVGDKNLDASNHREDDELAKPNEGAERGKLFAGSDANTGLEDKEKDQAEEKNKSVVTSNRKENDIDAEGETHLSDAKNRIVNGNVPVENNKQTDKDASTS
eukprot:gene5948-11301_t